ncbi:MAG: general secretion pathway protein GspJ [Deltaproteobacteria bacterium]|nr:MAG: general secretion pathway protein GspJ [Deltaproteobacteria bacterium]
MKRPTLLAPRLGARSGERKLSHRGFTLLEVMVSIGIIAMIAVLIYGAFHGMTRSRRNISHLLDRHQQGRAALSRMGRELSSAFISAHLPIGQMQITRQTAFIGTDQGGADRVDFTAFAHRRLARDTHESDQAEISYFGARDPDTGNLDLVRRIDKTIDEDSGRGGIVQVLAENIESLDILYLDPVTGEWLESWDSTQPASQLGRLPAQVWITIMLADGPGGKPVQFETKTALPIQLPLTFAASN